MNKRFGLLIVPFGNVFTPVAGTWPFRSNAKGRELCESSSVHIWNTVEMVLQTPTPQTSVQRKELGLAAVPPCRFAESTNGYVFNQVMTARVSGCGGSTTWKN